MEKRKSKTKTIQIKTCNFLSNKVTVSNCTQEKFQSQLITNMQRFFPETFIRTEYQLLFHWTPQQFLCYNNSVCLCFYEANFIVLSTSQYTPSHNKFIKFLAGLLQIIEQKDQSKYSQNVINMKTLRYGSFDFMQNRKILKVDKF